MNPYMVFSQEQRKKIVIANPSRKADIGGVAKEIGALWRGLTEEQKASYKGKKSSTRKASKKAPAPAPVAVEVVVKTPTAKVSKTRKAGKRGLSPYMQFFKANYAKVSKANPGKKVTEVAKEIGKLWQKQK